MKSFLFANVPLSVVHFILFVIFGGFFGWPGYVVASALGAVGGSILWWCVMALNSLVWGGVLTLFVFPFLRKLLK
jgi:hypothetical protein